MAAQSWVFSEQYQLMLDKKIYNGKFFLVKYNGKLDMDFLSIKRHGFETGHGPLLPFLVLILAWSNSIFLYFEH